jgi:hypothetical protein
MPLTRLRSSGLAANLTLGNVTVSGTLSNNTGSEFVTAATASAGPKITNIQVVDSSYTVLDDTAVDIAGGNIKLTGSGFNSGCQVIIGSTPASATTFVSSTEVIAQLPATVAGTYIVYLANTDGSVAIRVNGVTFSATPTWVTASTLAEQLVDIPISIQLSANSATAYSLAAGSTLPAGLTLSNVGLLSGSVTGLTNDTTYSFTVVATDIELQDSPRTFSVTISAGDQYGMNTVLLLKAENTTLPFNSDASTNNFTATANGDVRPNNFNPYTPGYYSNYFDGTGDYLTVADNVALQVGSSDFTIEAWVYHISLPSASNYKTLWSKRPTTSNSGGSCLVIDSSGNYLFFVASSSSVWQLSGTNTGHTVSLNTWTHIAMVRSGNNLILYKNGSAGTTATLNFTVYDSGALALMAGAENGAQAVDGYMSNFRMVKGTALYTANFTPAIAPLSAVSGTSLLTCQSNRFIDTSSNNFAITKNGNTSISSFVPFTPDTSYKTYGSGYFDGTGDYLSTASDAAFAFGTGDYTIEAWVCPTSIRNGENLIYVTEVSGGTSFGFSQTGIYIGARGVTFDLSLSYSVPANAWTHLVASRESGTVRIFANGNLVGSGAVTRSCPQGPGAVGDYPGVTGNGVTGYISNVRVVKGTAVYTSSFTPPTAPLAAVSGTSLLTLQTNQGVNNNQFLDNSTNNFLITRNGHTTQGSFSPYGSRWSNYFDGTGDWLTQALLRVVMILL